MPGLKTAVLILWCRKVFFVTADQVEGSSENIKRQKPLALEKRRKIPVAEHLDGKLLYIVFEKQVICLDKKFSGYPLMGICKFRKRAGSEFRCIISKLQIESHHLIKDQIENIPDPWSNGMRINKHRAITVKCLRN